MNGNYRMERSGRMPRSSGTPSQTLEGTLTSTLRHGDYAASERTGWRQPHRYDDTRSLAEQSIGYPSDRSRQSEVGYVPKRASGTQGGYPSSLNRGSDVEYNYSLERSRGPQIDYNDNRQRSPDGQDEYSSTVALESQVSFHSRRMPQAHDEFSDTYTHGSQVRYSPSGSDPIAYRPIPSPEPHVEYPVMRSSAAEIGYRPMRSPEAPGGYRPWRSPEAQDRYRTMCSPDAQNRSHLMRSPKAQDPYPSRRLPDAQDRYHSMHSSNAPERYRSTRSPEVQDIYYPSRSPEVQDIYGPTSSRDVQNRYDSMRSSTPQGFNRLTPSPKAQAGYCPTRSPEATDRHRSMFSSATQVGNLPFCSPAAQSGNRPCGTPVAHARIRPWRSNEADAEHVPMNSSEAQAGYVPMQSSKTQAGYVPKRSSEVEVSHPRYQPATVDPYPPIITSGPKTSIKTLIRSHMQKLQPQNNRAGNNTRTAVLEQSKSTSNSIYEQFMQFKASNSIQAFEASLSPNQYRSNIAPKERQRPFKSFTQSDLAPKERQRPFKSFAQSGGSFYNRSGKNDKKRGGKKWGQRKSNRRRQQFSSYKASVATGPSRPHVAVAHERYPIDVIDPEQAVLIKADLLRKIDFIKEGPPPRFTGVKRRVGLLTIDCADEATKKWVQEVIPNCIPWEGAKLKCLASERAVKMSVFIPNVTDTAKIFHLFEHHNPGLRTSKWRVLFSKPSPKGVQLILGMDLDSWGKIEQQNGLLINDIKVQFEFMGKRTVAEMELEKLKDAEAHLGEVKKATDAKGGISKSYAMHSDCHLEEPNEGQSSESDEEGYSDDHRAENNSDKRRDVKDLRKPPGNNLNEPIEEIDLCQSDEEDQSHATVPIE